MRHTLTLCRQTDLRLHLNSRISPTKTTAVASNKLEDCALDTDEVHASLGEDREVKSIRDAPIAPVKGVSTSEDSNDENPVMADLREKLSRSEISMDDASSPVDLRENIPKNSADEIPRDLREKLQNKNSEEDQAMDVDMEKASSDDSVLAIIDVIPAATKMGEPLRIIKKKVKRRPVNKPSTSTDDDSVIYVDPPSERDYESPEPGQYRKGGWCLDSTTPETPDTAEQERKDGCKYYSRGENSPDLSYDSYDSSGVVTHRPSGEVIYRPGNPTSSTRTSSDLMLPVVEDITDDEEPPIKNISKEETTEPEPEKKPAKISAEELQEKIRHALDSSTSSSASSSSDARYTFTKKLNNYSDKCVNNVTLSDLTSTVSEFLYKKKTSATDESLDCALDLSKLRMDGPPLLDESFISDTNLSDVCEVDEFPENSERKCEKILEKMGNTATPTDLASGDADLEHLLDDDQLPEDRLWPGIIPSTSTPGTTPTRSSDLTQDDSIPPLVYSTESDSGNSSSVNDTNGQPGTGKKKFRTNRFIEYLFL